MEVPIIAAIATLLATGLGVWLKARFDGKQAREKALFDRSVEAHEHLARTLDEIAVHVSHKVVPLFDRWQFDQPHWSELDGYLKELMTIKAKLVQGQTYLTKEALLRAHKLLGTLDPINNLLLELSNDHSLLKDARHEFSSMAATISNGSSELHLLARQIAEGRRSPRL